MFQKQSTQKILYYVIWSISILLFITSLSIIISEYYKGNIMTENTESYHITTVECNIDQKDIGTIQADTTVTFDYIFKNTGSDTLRVLFISPDCNCTGYKLSSKKVSTNDSIVLSLDINMRNKHKGEFMLNTVVGLNTEQRLYGIRVKGKIE